MESLSISFTLGKASLPHNVNVKHNNREFIASNVKKEKIINNITYVHQDVEDAYRQLFSKAIEDYNAKQKQQCRKINDYYKHISASKREEAFYEIIVQFGDNQTAGVDTPNGDVAKKMLDEYMKTFQERNPNLYVFNAVLHMDEASPHLHIDFIPYYTHSRVNGLSKGVSMRSALDEQGFSGKSSRENRLVAWEESERNYMEDILHKHNLTRDDKKAHYKHMSVDEYKLSMDARKTINALKKTEKVSPDELEEKNIIKLKSKIISLENENKNLLKEKTSPYKSFFYSVPEKISYVQSQLDLLSIPYHETDNGFEAKECYADQIRLIEKNFVPVKKNFREQLRNDIDKLLMQSSSFDELMKKLISCNYTIKTGKYISVKPENSSAFIRLKSIGEFYSEQALVNRINANKKFEKNIDEKLQSAQHEFSISILKTIKLYTIAFKDNTLPVKKINSKEHFSWTNDSEIDMLMRLNNQINAGATIETIRNDYKAAEDIVRHKENQINIANENLSAYIELKEKIEIIFENKNSSLYTRKQAEDTLKQYPSINEKNYRNIEKLISDTKDKIKNFSVELENANTKLKSTSDMVSISEKILNGTYVQSLVVRARHNNDSHSSPTQQNKI